MRALILVVLLAACGDNAPPPRTDAGPLACDDCPAPVDPASCTRLGTCDCATDAGAVACSWRAR